MATLVKEKRNQKKKTKDKSRRIEHQNNEPIVEIKDGKRENVETSIKRESVENITIKSNIETPETSRTMDTFFIDTISTDRKTDNLKANNTQISDENSVQEDIKVANTIVEINTLGESSKISFKDFNYPKADLDANEIGNTYMDLNERLKKIQIPSLERTDLDTLEVSRPVKEDIATGNSEDIMVPSAPLLDIPNINCVSENTNAHNPITSMVKTKIPCMPLEQAIKIFGGTEMEEIRAMSEREEAMVESGPVSGPEHPLVDLLSTFRSSLSALERERITVNCGYLDEEKRRQCLWKVEKRSINISEKCPCGARVDLRAVFEYAELLKDRLPAAKMRLEGLLRDVKESYCYHQHAALLAHCQIEELISETVKSNKNEIREALSLILVALRVSDGAGALPDALQRWAAILTDALIDHRDVRQLLFVIHHLFRQSRSVQWAGRVMRIHVGDTSSAATLIAILDILLSGPGLEHATECAEEQDTWEEVDIKGEGGAVGDGRLRERDLVLLLNSLPLADLVARLALMRTDISGSRWGDRSGGHGARKAGCGARALLRVLARGPRRHPRYSRLTDLLRTVAEATLRALAALHLQSRDSYNEDLQDTIQSELEACFAAGTVVMGEQLDRLPATLLSEDTAKEYCSVLENLHDKSAIKIESLNVELPQMACDVRVRILTQAAIDRELDHALARHVLDFLFRTGIVHKASNLKCGCVESSRTQLARLLDGHPYLHTIIFHTFAEVTKGEADSSLIQYLCPSKWRPTAGEIRAVLDDWLHKCPQLLQHLLLSMDYTPPGGVCLESQLFIGWWVYNYVPEAPEWAWDLMRKLRLHRSHWAMPLEAQALENPPETLLGSMYAVLATDWGHCLPLVCGPGAEALYSLAVSRAADAVHCLARLVTVLASSPESIALTPRLGEAITAILNWTPNLMQRALGRGAAGADVLLRTVVQQVAVIQHPGYRSAVVGAWAGALWARGARGLAALDAAVRAAKAWPALHAHVATQDIKKATEDILKHASTAPLLCEAVLHAALSVEMSSGLNSSLLHLLSVQRNSKQRIHVDNALKQAGSTVTSEELVIHRTASAVLMSPLQHPAHLLLWRLLLHLYLQRSPGDSNESSPPVGPLFFSGLVKTRTLAQLKRRLQEAITYHHNEIDKLNREQTIDSPDTSTRLIERSPTSDGLFEELSIRDMVESIDESSDGVEEMENVDVQGVVKDTSDDDKTYLLAYHTGAERLLREYSRWLDEGEKTRAWPHNADISRFIPEQALSAAWSASVPQTKQETSEAPVSPPRASYHEMALKAIRSINTNFTYDSLRPKKYKIESLVKDVNFQDARAVLKSIDQRLGEVVDFAKEWTAEVNRIGQLDGQLWELVGKLRVRRPLPPVNKACPQNCKPITIHIAEDEWCIAAGVEREIQENRRAYRACVRRLCRARPHFARTAAALLSCARRTCSAASAEDACERVWRYMPLAHSCVLAAQLLTNVATIIAEKWICGDGGRCARLLSRWAGGARAQLALCSALVAPALLPLADWPLLYTAICDTSLPSDAAFSYLSKLDMSRWGHGAESAQRQEMLRVMLRTAQKWGAQPEPRHYVLIELLGVQSAALVTARELDAWVCACVRCAARCTLPAVFCPHLVNAVATLAGSLTFDQIGNLLRDVGGIWWEARKGGEGTSPQMCTQYAAPLAAVLTRLQRAFVRCAVAMSYAPERVTLYSWSSIQESWSPWILPQSLPPLLPSTADDEVYTTMLERFIDCLQMVMEECPGSAEPLLSEVWRFALDTYNCTHGVASSQEARVQLSALLVALSRLPWQHQWYNTHCLTLAVQISRYPDKEITCWCSNTLNHTTTDTWLRGVLDQHLAPTLANLFALFTSKNMQFSRECLSQACGLPWWRLPDAALEQLLDQYFVEHYNPALPYHELPHYCVVLTACQLRVSVHTPQAVTVMPCSHVKRCDAVSRIVRAVASPAIAAHLSPAIERLMDVICELVPHIIENSEDQLQEILSRATAILCIQHAANIVIPVFKEYMSRDILRASALGAVSSLTALDAFVPLADALAAAHLQHGTTGWSEVERRWQASAWWEASACIKRGGLHAAFGLLRANRRGHTPRQLRDAMVALAEGNINFTDNEEIIALWICVACRLATQQERESLSDADGVEKEIADRRRHEEGREDRDVMECRQAAKALIDKWSVESKKNLLQLVALQASEPAPTQKQRTLSRFAQSIITPSLINQTFETSIQTTLGLSEVTREQLFIIKHLVTLANKLYPGKEVYFKEELEMAGKCL